MPALSVESVDDLSMTLWSAAKVSDGSETKCSELAGTSQTICLPREIPYQTQHRILTQVQIWLEGACFDFAERWLPELLRDNAWEVPEEVELTQWTKIFRKNASKLPTAATEESSGKHLKSALCATHKLRHAAVHRLRISTAEIKSMMADAVVLAKILKDQRRANSIARLLEAVTKGSTTFGDRRSDIEKDLATKLASISLQRKELDVAEQKSINDATKKYDQHRHTLVSDLETILDQATNTTQSKSTKERERPHFNEPKTAVVSTTAGAPAETSTASSVVISRYDRSEPKLNDTGDEVDDLAEVSNNEISGPAYTIPPLQFNFDVMPNGIPKRSRRVALVSRPSSSEEDDGMANPLQVKSRNTSLKMHSPPTQMKVGAAERSFSSASRKPTSTDALGSYAMPLLEKPHSQEQRTSSGVSHQPINLWDDQMWPKEGWNF